MTTEELINKINRLAKKQREEGLSSNEKKEQEKARREYLKSIKAQVSNSLEARGIKKKSESHNCCNGCNCQ